MKICEVYNRRSTTIDGLEGHANIGGEGRKAVVSLRLQLAPQYFSDNPLEPLLPLLYLRHIPFAKHSPNPRERKPQILLLFLSSPILISLVRGYSRVSMRW